MTTKVNKIYQGDCLEVIPTLEDNSIDAIVTDPPYELGFMGKKWDASGIAYNVDLWKECLRVLKPGGHLLTFSGTRTYHRMAVAIEDAGFEVRDMLEWIYASGFPKSLNVGKAVDKLQGNEREVVGKSRAGSKERNGHKGDMAIMPFETETIDLPITKGNSPYEGFGTALKPAHEPICMARKPLECKTIVDNVIKWGTGAIDIDGTRIPINENDDVIAKNPHTASKGTDEYDQNCYGKYNPTEPTNYKDVAENSGRFPANIIVSDDALNDGEMTKGWTGQNHSNFNPYGGNALNKSATTREGYHAGFGDTGSKSRYFDIDVWAEKYGLLQFPKASKRERNEGLDELEAKQMYKQDGSGQSLEIFGSTDGGREARKNFHPTVKPVHLMAWLVRLVSKEGDTVLDPFAGSGTTGVACKKLNRNFIGIELTEDYLPIIQARTSAETIKAETSIEKKIDPPIEKIENSVRVLKKKTNICPFCGGKVKGKYCEDCLEEINK